MSQPKPSSEAVEALKALENRRGQLLPEDVVAAAKPKDSPLHSYFEWDDRKAAVQYRLDQARELIRSVRVEYQVETRVIAAPAYVHDPDKGNEAGYISVSKLKRNSDGSHAALVAEFSAAGAHLRRARDLAHVLGFGGHIDELLERYDAIQSVIMGEQSA